MLVVQEMETVHMSAVLERSDNHDALARKRVSVVHLVSNLNMGGLEKVVYDLTRCADHKRFSVSVICLGEIGDLAKEFESIGVPVESLGLSNQGVLRRALALARRWRTSKPNILHTHNVAPHIAGAIAAKLCGDIRIVHTKHGQNYPIVWKVLLVNRIASWLTDRIVPVSKDAAEIAIHREGVPERKITVIRNGIDLMRFSYTDRTEPSSQCKAIHVARLNYPTKDQDTLLRAVRLVADAEPRFVLDIVGVGPHREHLERLCDELQLRPHVKFLGARRDVHALLSRADMFVLSSISEGLPITLLEAMATGLPVVSTGVGGVPELVVQGETGLLVPERSPDALSDAILEIIRNPQRAHKMGAAGRKCVAEHFDLQHVAATYEELYESLVTDHKSDTNDR